MQSHVNSTSKVLSETFIEFIDIFKTFLRTRYDSFFCYRHLEKPTRNLLKIVGTAFVHDHCERDLKLTILEP